jgi:hypothetical protein
LLKRRDRAHLDEVVGVGVSVIECNVEVLGVGVGASTGWLVSCLPDPILTSYMKPMHLNTSRSAVQYTWLS